MADHAWVLEHIASYTAGGLASDERADLEEHVVVCPDCAHELEETRQLDRTLDTLFADARPRPGLEDRMVDQVRRAQRQAFLHSPVFRFSLGAAAVLLLGMFGAAMSSLLEGGVLPFPGMQAKGSLHDKLNFLMASADAPMTAGAPVADARAEWAIRATDANLENDEIGNNPALPTAAAMADGKVKQDLQRVPGGSGGRSGATRERTRGNDADKPTNYNVDRIEDVSVPGPANPNEQVGIMTVDVTKAQGQPVQTTAPAATLPPAPGFGFAAGGQGGGVFKEPAKAPMAGERKGKDSAGSMGYYSYRDTSRGEGKSPTDDKLAKLRDGETAEKKAEYYQPGKAKEVEEVLNKKDAPRNAPADAKPKPQSNTVAQAPKADPSGSATPAEAPPVTQRKIIRSGDIEFEIDVFDTAVEKITKIAAEERGFVATVNSEKLPNGKVRGSIVVRVPPDRLDTLILKLRALGDLKNQKIGSQDVTKQYTDMESRLRAARAMENRLLEIIKTGKGEIKDLIVAEKELGTWRTKIEEMEGELRYYNNLISLSTLNVTLVEREIRAAFGITETEKIDMGIEVEDVEKAQQQAHAAVTEAKGRITKSELKQQAAGQFQAIIHFAVAPDAAGALRDRLKQLGEVTRLEVGRVQQAEGGTDRPQETKVKRDDVQFLLSLYNVANVMPRETVQLNLACIDTETVYRAILDRVAKAAGGRVVTHNLDRQRNDQIRGVINFEVKTADANDVLDAIQKEGEIMRKQIVENPDTQNVTKSKRGFQVQLWGLATVMPRETAMVQLATRDVPASFVALKEAVAAAKGRVLNDHLSEQDRQNVSAQLDFEVRRSEEKAIAKALAGAGVVMTRSINRAQDNENVSDAKVRTQLTIVNVANIRPRETETLGIEVPNVDKTRSELMGLVTASNGHSVESHVNHTATGLTTAKLVFDVPLSKQTDVLDKLKAAGVVRTQQSSRNPQVPESDLAVARFDVVLSGATPIVASDEGIGASMRQGLAYSFKAIAFSLSWVIVGLCFVLPWAAIGYGIYRLAVRGWRKPEVKTTAA